MKESIKQVWIEALRSNKYEQCTQVLHLASGEFCALGVLVEVYRKQFPHALTAWEDKPGDPGVLQAWSNSDDEPFALDLPQEVLQWAEMKHDEMDAVQGWNDRLSWTFEQIALEASIYL